jgi:hypothetical protein
MSKKNRYQKPSTPVQLPVPDPSPVVPTAAVADVPVIPEAPVVPTPVVTPEPPVVAELSKGGKLFSTELNAYLSLFTGLTTPQIAHKIRHSYVNLIFLVLSSKDDDVFEQFYKFTTQVKGKMVDPNSLVQVTNTYNRDDKFRFTFCYGAWLDMVKYCEGSLPKFSWSPGSLLQTSKNEAFVSFIMEKVKQRSSAIAREQAWQ